MSDLGSKVIIGFGPHANAQDLTSTPAFVHQLPEKQGFFSPEFTKLERAPAHPQNKLFGPVRGPLDLKTAIQLEQIITGLSGNTGGAIASATTSEIGPILNTVFGTPAIDPAGAVTTATGGVGATKTLAVTEMARFPVGTVITFVTTVPVATYVRQVRARAGASGAGNLTLDRIYTGTVTNGQNVFRCARWVDDPSVYEHIHGAFFAEYDNDRRMYLGGMSRAQMQFTRGQYARLMTSWLFTDVQDIAETDPAFVEPVRGSAIMNANSAFFIGDVQYYATDLSVQLGGAVVPRQVDNGPHGILGYLVEKGESKPNTTLKVKLLRGVNAGETKDSGADPFTMNKAQGFDVNGGDPINTYDVAFHFSTAAGALCYGVGSVAAMKSAKEVIVDGYKMIDLEIEFESPSAASLLFPFEFHLG